MLNECSPRPADRVVALHSRIKSEEGGVAVAEPRAIVRGGTSRAALYLAHINSRPQERLQAPVPVPEQAERTFWSSVFDFLVEGFANCGALYPVAHLSADGPSFEMEIPVREAFAANGRRLSLVSDTVRKVADAGQVTDGLTLASLTFLDSKSSHRVLPERARPQSDALPSPETGRPDHWSWLRSSWEVVAAVWTHLRREREIRQAMDVLAELDDFTLKDIGIHHRGQIEHAVRNGHDC